MIRLARYIFHVYQKNENGSMVDTHILVQGLGRKQRKNASSKKEYIAQKGQPRLEGSFFRKVEIWYLEVKIGCVAHDIPY